MTGHLTHASPPRANDDATTLIAALNNPLAFGHQLQYHRLIETHISWIILTGNYAYKIKKPVNFGFLDFSTLQKRHFYCEEELRLNRRFAPEIYLELVEIRGSINAPRMHGGGEIIEYAIKMLEFPQQYLLSNYAARHGLNPELIDAIAARVSAMHAESEPADATTDYGSASISAAWSDENIRHIANAIPAELLPNSYFGLKRWYQENRKILGRIDERKYDGFVRECHGDLHLGNMALLSGRVTLFDCIEFNPELRWIDTISEAAFVAMDLEARGYPEYCWRFINHYLEASDDYAGIELLRYYMVYRALVRAKVEALGVDQETHTVSSYAAHLQPAIDYIDLADRWAQCFRPALIIMHGLSGSGKSTIAAQLAEALGAIQIRSDVIRKRLYNLAADAQTDSALAQGIYSNEATEATYRRLQEIAASVIEAGFTVIVDATFLQESRRRQMLGTESNIDYKKLIIDCQVPELELRKRIMTRQNDPSEANLAVLDQQLITRQAISEDEARRHQVISIGSDGIDAAKILQISKRLVRD